MDFEIRSAANIDLMKIDIPEWLLEGRYLSGYVTITIGPGGVGKSLFMILESLAVAANRNLTYDRVFDGGGPVLIYSADDTFDELERRIMAAAKYYEISREALRNMYFLSGYTSSIKLAALDEYKRPLPNEEEIQSLIEYIMKRGVKLFIVNSYPAFHQFHENARFMMKIFRQIASQTGCAISLVHAPLNGNMNKRGNINNSLEDSSLVDLAPIVHTLYPMSHKEAKKYDLTPDQANGYVRFNKVKSNYEPPEVSRGKWFKKVSVQLEHDPDETTYVMEMAPEPMIEIIP